MQTFRIEGEFEAADIQEAFEWLGAHFTALAEGRDNPDVRVMHITIHPKEGE